MIGAIRRYFLRRRIVSMFGAYVNPTLVDQLVTSGEAPELGGQDKEITPFFASVDSYLGIAERVASAQLVEVMNMWFDACTEAIVAQGGCIDKFVGDAVVAMFGAPLPAADHAARACTAAVAIQEQMERASERLSREGRLPEPLRQLRGRIGLHTGMAIVGNMGTRTRFNYTMMGDSVNLAARLESGAKSYGVWNMCSSETKLACEQHRQGALVFRSLGEIVVMGQAAPLEIFEIVGRRETVTDQTRECVALFERGLARLQAKDWDGAIALFARSMPLERHQPGTSSGVRCNPSTVFSKRALALRADPEAETQFFR